MIKLKKLIKENKRIYEYGCVMLDIKFPDMEHIQSLISPYDIYTVVDDSTFGLEDHPHITLLYGLHDGVPFDSIKSVINRFKYTDCKLINPSLFESDEYDVLKFDVVSYNLEEINEALREFPHTTSFTNYHPHCTIAYLHKGTGNRYIDMLNASGQNVFWTIPTHVRYTEPSGKINKMKVYV